MPNELQANKKGLSKQSFYLSMYLSFEIEMIFLELYVRL